jgi:hypothetical protein
MNFYASRYIDTIGRKFVLQSHFAPAMRKARKPTGHDKRPRHQYINTLEVKSPKNPSYTSEHLRMKPVMDVVRRSKDCKPISAGFEIQGEVQARVTWVWHEEREEIIGVNIETDQFELAEQKVKVLFTQAGLPEPTCIRA